MKLKTILLTALLIGSPLISQAGELGRFFPVNGQYYFVEKNNKSREIISAEEIRLGVKNPQPVLYCEESGDCLELRPGYSDVRHYLENHPEELR